MSACEGGRHEGKDGSDRIGSSISRSTSFTRSTTEFLRTLLTASSPAEQQKLLDDKLAQDRKSHEDRYAKYESLTPEERGERVNKRLEDSRRFWLGKIKEYEAFPPEERERRLEITHQAGLLRGYLKPLMTATTEQRAKYLADIPEEYRKLVTDRLAAWEKLPPDLRHNLVEHDSVMHYFARLEAKPAELRQDPLESIPSSYRSKLEDDIRRWNGLPAELRASMSREFDRLFQLPESARDRALTYLPDEERRRIEASFEKLGQIPPDEQKHCMDSYRKYSNLTPEQRQQFMKNAERWKSMSDAEKEAWRALSAKLPPLPPTPPGMPPPLPQPPPSPPPLP